MNASYNPFIRGYENFTIERKAMIVRDGVSRPVYRSFHASQDELADAYLTGQQCIYRDEYCFFVGSNVIPLDVLQDFGTTGFIVGVVYLIQCTQNGIDTCLGPAPSVQDAQGIIENLRFETGFYSRSWEISSAHITRQDFERLELLADTGCPRDALFEAFQLRKSNAIGVKLIATPWTDQELRADDTNVFELCLALRDIGLSESLIDVMLLAAQADTRILIFDPDAPALEGLAHYDW
jgi:hypothetical protein